MINPISAKNDTSINFPAAVTRKIRAERTVTSEFLLNWFVNFVILFLVLKEIPSKKAAV